MKPHIKRPTAEEISAVVSASTDTMMVYIIALSKRQERRQFERMHVMIIRIDNVTEWKEDKEEIRYMLNQERITRWFPDDDDIEPSDRLVDDERDRLSSMVNDHLPFYFESDNDDIGIVRECAYEALRDVSDIAYHKIVDADVEVVDRVPGLTDECFKELEELK